MAARGSRNAGAAPGRTARGSLFSLAERQVIALYDAGVLSPAVLQHVIAAYAGRDVDWHEEARERSVDHHSVHEVVVLTMMPGRALRQAQKDFLSVVGHLMGSSADAAAASSVEAEDDDALLSQLSSGMAGSEPGTRSRERPEAATRQSPGFNPLVQAKALRRAGKA